MDMTTEFIIVYECGDRYNVIAPDEKTAFHILYGNHPELRTKDLLKVCRVPTPAKSL